MSEWKCEDVAPHLQDFVDGMFGPRDERRMREHLAECAICRREEKELRRLLTLVAELPRSVEPPRDLWPELAERLVERPAGPPREGRAEERRTARPARGSWSVWTPRRWAWQAAAAVAFMALGAGLARLAGPPAAPADAARTDAAAHGEVAPYAMPAALGPRIGLDAVEAEYLRAKEALWILVYSRHEDVSPVTLEIVRHNLVILDDAIRDLREALTDDPGNRRLEGRLLAQHRRSIDLLRRLAENDPPRTSAGASGTSI